MVSTPTMHSDKDMKSVLLHVSETDVVGIVTLWMELFKVIHRGYHLSEENLYDIYQLIPLWFNCAMNPNGCFLHAISNCGTVSSFNSIRKKTTFMFWRRIPHIIPLLQKVYLPMTESFVELEHYHLCLLYKLLGIGHLYNHSSAFRHVIEARKHLFVSVIDMHVTFHHRRSLTQHVMCAANQDGHVWGHL